MRQLPLTDADRAAMLSVIGAKSVDKLFADVPAAARLDMGRTGLPTHAREMAVERKLTTLAARNLSTASALCFLGYGVYRYHILAVVDALIQRGEFLTAYTPCQSEISQSTLQYLFKFQTPVALLTGMEGPPMPRCTTALPPCAEAVAMACRPYHPPGDSRCCCPGACILITVRLPKNLGALPRLPDHSPTPRSSHRR